MEWCLAHPWMTFTLVLTAIFIFGAVIEGAIANISRVRIVKYGNKEQK